MHLFALVMTANLIRAHRETCSRNSVLRGARVHSLANGMLSLKDVRSETLCTPVHGNSCVDSKVCATSMQDVLQLVVRAQMEEYQEQ